MITPRFVAVVGARTLPEAWADRVGAIVRHFLGRGWGIGSGGARGADAYALRAVVTAGPAACARSVLYLPGRLHQCPDPLLGAFVAGGRHVVAGMDVGRTALLARSRRLAGAAAGVVDTDAGVIAYTVAEARHRGVEVVVAELVALIADLETAEPLPDTDALDHAEALGDGVDAITADGRLAPTGQEADDEAPGPAADAWHAIGSIEPEWVRCPGCGARFVADDEAAELPTCHNCGTRDTWEARQDSGFRALLAAIDRCTSRAALGALGRRLYARRLRESRPGSPGRTTGSARRRSRPARAGAPPARGSRLPRRRSSAGASAPAHRARRPPAPPLPAARSRRLPKEPARLSPRPARLEVPTRGSRHRQRRRIAFDGPPHGLTRPAWFLALSARGNRRQPWPAVPRAPDRGRCWERPQAM